MENCLKFRIKKGSPPVFVEAWKRIVIALTELGHPSTRMLHEEIARNVKLLPTLHKNDALPLDDCEGRSWGGFGGHSRNRQIVFMSSTVLMSVDDTLSFYMRPFNGVADDEEHADGAKEWSNHDLIDFQYAVAMALNTYLNKDVTGKVGNMMRIEKSIIVWNEDPTKTKAQLIHKNKKMRMDDPMHVKTYIESGDNKCYMLSVCEEGKQLILASDMLDRLKRYGYHGDIKQMIQMIREKYGPFESHPTEKNTKVSARYPYVKEKLPGNKVAFSGFVACYPNM